MAMMNKGEKTKLHILDTARMMFWKNNYQGTKVDQICKQANVNKATFYMYFKSKNDIALSAIDANTDQIINGLFVPTFEKIRTPVERLVSIYQQVYDYHLMVYKHEGKIRGCPLVNMGMELSTSDDMIRKRLEVAFKRIYPFYVEIYRQAYGLGLTKVKRDENEMAVLLHGVMNGGIVASKIENNPNYILVSLNGAKAVLGVPLDA